MKEEKRNSRFDGLLVVQTFVFTDHINSNNMIKTYDSIVQQIVLTHQCCFESCFRSLCSETIWRSFIGLNRYPGKDKGW